MQVVYDRLFALLKSRNITQKDVKTDLGFSNSVFDKLRINGCITSETIGKLCAYLQCTPNDIMEIQFDENDATYESMKQAKIRQKIADLQKELKNE